MPNALRPRRWKERPDAGPSRRSSQLLGVIAIALTLFVAASCSSSKSRSTSPASSINALRRLRTDVPPPMPVSWQDCDGLQCGSVVVPVDYRHPDAATIRLALTRRPAENAAHRLGVLLFDPGGPGEGAGGALRTFVSAFPAVVRQRFDIVAMDRRGTGGSNKLNCGPTPTEVVSAPLSAAAQRDLTERYRQTLAACRHAERAIGSADTVTAARDLDRVRQALDEAHIAFWGLSYGTLLGNTYLQLFPNRVQAMVLDGAVDPAQSLISQTRDQAAAAEDALSRLLDRCRAKGPACPLGPDPTHTYSALRSKLAASPLPSPGNGDGRPVGDGDLAASALIATTLPGLFESDFLDSAAAAALGNGSKLRSLATTLYIDDDGSSVIGPYWTTVCDDTTGRPSAGQIQAEADSLGAKFPNQGREAVTYLLPGCVGWPPAKEPLPTAPATGAPPVVVLAGVADPQTPLAWGRRVVRQLGAGVGRLIIRNGNGHTALLNGGGQCVTDLVAAYLTTQAIPPAETTCAVPAQP